MFVPPAQEHGDHGIKNKWFAEALSKDLYQVSSIKKIEFAGKSNFQNCDIMELGSFGRCLVLDNMMQSSEVDEFIYHESLIHPALLTHPNPKRVFIGGGGECATAREILKHKSVEEVVMVDIDGYVVDLCKKFLPNHHKQSFEDKRFKLIIDDAKKYLEESPDNYFDIIIMDLADPLEGGPCYQLYTVEFYEMCKRKLTADGMFATQAGLCGLQSFQDMFTPLCKTLQEVFHDKVTALTNVFMPCYLDSYAFITCGKSLSSKQMTPEEIDKKIAERITGGADALRFYDGECHLSLIHMQKHIKAGLNAEKRIMRKDNYIFHPSYVERNQEQQE